MLEFNLADKGIAFVLDLQDLCLCSLATASVGVVFRIMIFGLPEFVARPQARADGCGLVAAKLHSRARL